MSSVAELPRAAPSIPVDEPGSTGSEGSRGTRRRELLAVLVGALGIALLLWTLAGFNRVPTWEGWVIFRGFDQGFSGWWLTPGSSGFAGSSGRPLEVLPHQLGYFLSPETFLGFNMVSMLAFVARGVGAYLLLKELLRGHRAAAAVGALVFALSPSADGMMIDRVIHVQWAGALAIGGFAALLISVRTGRTVLAVLGTVLACAGLMMYEVVLPVVALMPVFAVLAATGIRRRALKMVAIYCGGVLITGVYLLWFRSQLPFTYQDGIATLRLPLTDRTGVLATLDALRWEFGGSVLDTVRDRTPLARPALGAAGWAVALTISAVGILAAVLLSRRRFDLPATGRRELLEPVALGLVWIGASLAIMLPFAPYRYETLRAHSVAQFGAVLVFAAVLKFAFQRIRAVGLLLAAAGLVAASYVAGSNALMWKQQSDFQSQLISSFIAQTATLDPDTPVVVHDRTDRLGHIYQMGPFGQYLGVARNMLVDGPPLHVVVCTTGIGSNDYDPAGRCTFTDDGVEVASYPGYPGSVFFDRDDTLELELVGGDQPQLRPRDGSDGPRASDIPDRARAALPCLIGERCAADAVAAPLPRVPVFEDFWRHDRYEDIPHRGAPVEDFGELNRGTSERWTTAPDSAIYADLDEGRYVVRASVLHTTVGAEEVDDLRLSLNGVDLETSVRTEGDRLILEAVGTVDDDSPRADRVGIQGPVKVEPGHWEDGLGMAVDWISVDVAP